jgi:hypothetical protein
MIEFNVRDYGAAGDGLADDRAEIVAAASAAGAGRGIYVPSGTYRVASNLTLTCATTFAPGARLSIPAGVTVTLNGAMIAGLTQLFTGAGRVKFGEGRVAEIYPQWWGAVDDQGSSTDSTNAIQSALNALGIWGGRIVLPQGRYIVTSTITVPGDVTDGRTIEIVGNGEAVLHNRAAPNNPTLRAVGPNSQSSHRRIAIRNLVFTGESRFPNHGIHWRFVIESSIENCVFCCHGSGIRIDGGVFGLVFRNVHIWPEAGRKHRSPTAHTGSSGILFDTPVQIGNYAHTITIDDLVVAGGGRGIEVKPGYVATGWELGRLLLEGLTGGNGWGLDLANLVGFRVGPVYTEVNTPAGPPGGDANDLMMRFDGCHRGIVHGGIGTGNIVLRNCQDITFVGTTCNNFNANATNERIHCYGVRHSIMATHASGYTNLSSEKVEWIQGAGAANPRVVHGQTLRGTPVFAGAGPYDDVFASGHAKRVVDATGTGTASRQQVFTFALAPGADYDLNTRNTAILMIETTIGETAIYSIHGAANIARELSDASSAFSPTKHATRSINVYYDAATSSYHVQNNLDATRNFVVFMFAAT